jgi:hypothetical protein
VKGGLNASRDTGRVKRHDPDGQQNAIPAERRPEHAGARRAKEVSTGTN